MCRRLLAVAAASLVVAPAAEARIPRLDGLAARSNYALGGFPSVRTGLRALPPCRDARQLVPTWRAAGAAFGLRPSILAAITEIESGHGCAMGPSSAGALGWTQFMPGTWEMWGMDADGDGTATPLSSADAIFASARYLRASGAPRSYQRALFAYNRAQWYVDDVLARAKPIDRAMPYPPAPWRIAGPAAIVPVPVPLALARAHVPADVAVVPVLPGHTAGGLLIARYEEGSTLAYGELLVFPALTRVDGSVGMWVSRAYVDSPASLAGGRRMWGVPKDLATFAWREGGVAVLHEDGRLLLDAAWRVPRRVAPLPGRTRSNGTTGGADRRAFAGSGRLTMGPARVTVEVPAASPFATLALGGRRLGLAGHADFRLRPPRVLAAAP